MQRAIQNIYEGEEALMSAVSKVNNKDTAIENTAHDPQQYARGEHVHSTGICMLASRTIRHFTG
jgi:hypothetical protein